MAFESFQLPNVSLPDNYTAVITGGHRGLGYEVAKYLLYMGSRVVLTCDDQVKGQAAVLRLQADLLEMKQAAETDSEETDRASSITPAPELAVEAMTMDTSSFISVKTFAEKFKKKGYPLNLLVCSDGVVCAPREYTADGNELHLQCNYLSHFLLITYLLPLMRSTSQMNQPDPGAGQVALEDCRILLVANKSLESGGLNLKNMQGRGQYNVDKFYTSSQVYLIMLMYMLLRRLHNERISVFAVHNGFVDKALKHRTEDPASWGAVYSVGRSLGKISKNVNKNVASCLKVAVVPQFKGLSGTYFVAGVPYTPSSPRVRDPKAQEALWGFTVQALSEYTSPEVMSSLELSEEEYSRVMGEEVID